MRPCHVVSGFLLLAAATFAATRARITMGICIARVVAPSRGHLGE